MKRINVFLIAFFATMMMASGQVPSLIKGLGSPYQNVYFPGWCRFDSGLILPNYDASKSPAGIAFNKPGRIWWSLIDSSVHIWNGIEDVLVGSGGGGADNQRLTLNNKDLTIQRGNTVTLPFAYTTDLPTSLSQLANDVPYIRGADTTSMLAHYAKTSQIPTDNSQLANGENYIRGVDTPNMLAPYARINQIPTNNNQLTNGEHYVRGIDTPVMLAPYARINQVPTKTSQLTNDAGFLNTETDPTLIAQKAQPNGVATLDPYGYVPTSQISNLFVTDVFEENSVTAMLGSDAEKGDICVRSDSALNFILADPPASSYSNWVQLRSAVPPVLSVNSMIGNVVLTSGDISEGTSQYFTQARARAAMVQGYGVTYNATTGVFSVDSSVIPHWIDTIAGHRFVVTPTYLASRGFITGNQTITVSGDATGSGTTSIPITFNNTGVTAGTYGGTSAMVVLTVDSKGRVLAVTTVNPTTGITGLTGDGTASGSGSVPFTLATVNSSPGTYGSVDNIPVITVDGKGRITAVTTVQRPVGSWRAACRVATTGAVTATYGTGSAGVGATLTNAGTQAAIAFDGVTLNVGDRVAFKDQASAFQNGVYSVTTTGSGSTNWVVTRTNDFDNSTTGAVVQGVAFIIGEGTTNAGLIIEVKDQGPYTLGSTAINFRGNSADVGGAVVGILKPVNGGTGLGTMNNQQLYSGGGGGTAMVQDPMLTWNNTTKTLLVDAAGAGNFVSTSPNITPPDKIVISNGMAATALTQQCSGTFTLQGNAWRSAATAMSLATKFKMFVLPIQGSTVTSRLYIQPYQQAIVGGSDSSTTPTAETYVDSKGNIVANKVYVGQPPAATGNSNSSVIVGSSPPTSLTGAANTIFGQGNMTSATSANSNVIIGDQVGTSIVGASGCIVVGSRSGTGTTGSNNTLITAGITQTITSGAGNFVAGNYLIPSGLRTLNNQAILSDGAGNLYLYKTTGGNLILNGSTTDDGSTLQVNGSVSTNKIVLNTAGTVVSGSTSGNATFSQPFQGSTYKKVVIYLASLIGTASYTYPTAFTNTPIVMSSNGLATTVATSVSTTAVTVTGATTTGFLIIEGY